MMIENLPGISVLIPVYNGEKYLVETIESVLNQTYKNFELIVIDDGGKDGSLAILERYAKEDSRCRVYSRENKGLVETRNELISLARADIIAWLDQDDVCFPSRLEKQYQYMLEHPECLAVGSDTLLIDEDGEPICGFFKSKSHEEIDAGNMSGVGSHICNPSVSLRKSAVVQVGGIRKQCVYAEDIDLFLRLAEVGKLAIIPEYLVKYRQHLSAAGYSSLRDIQIKSSQLAINEARTRRGLPLLSEEELKLQSAHTSVADVYVKWTWWALGDGYLNTAMKYALKLLAINPFKIEFMKINYCVLRAVVRKKFS
jgi:glycosyltransferase involved in cell wall biosynthesis